MAQVHIVAGRHPVLELLKGMVPNDARLAASGPRVQIITGPNMGGAWCVLFVVVGSRLSAVDAGLLVGPNHWLACWHCPC